MEIVPDLLLTGCLVAMVLGAFEQIYNQRKGPRRLTSKDKEENVWLEREAFNMEYRRARIQRAL